MSVKDIDNAISKLVREKQLLNKSMKRTVNEEEKKEIRKCIIRVNAEINKMKEKYNLGKCINE